MTLSVMMTLRVIDLNVTLGLKDTQCNDTQLSVIMRSGVTFYFSLGIMMSFC
jgi:hypothetical protein